MAQNDPQVLLLPGWQGSGPGHWQSHWQRRFGYQWVEQHDWQRPLRGDWITRLEEVVLNAPTPVVLVAHSLGAVLVAAWAGISRHTDKVAAALLVAPPDLAQAQLQAQLPSWRPVPRQPLPFASLLLASRDDPYASLAYSQALAQAWGSRWHDAGEAGHINADSGLGDWPQGQLLLQHICKESQRAW